MTKKPRKKWGDPGSKVTRRVSNKVWSGGKYRAVLVTTYPNGLIGYRLLGLRREYFRNAADDYRDAVRTTIATEKAAKKRARKK
jgi:hypothetical protein